MVQPAIEELHLPTEAPILGVFSCTDRVGTFAGAAWFWTAEDCYTRSVVGRDTQGGGQA